MMVGQVMFGFEHHQKKKIEMKSERKEKTIKRKNERKKEMKKNKKYIKSQ